VTELVQHYPNLELLLVGKPRAGGETEQLIEQLGIANHIRFVSGISTEQLVQFYAEAQVAVVPSVYEGFGLPAGEAMACGVPVVSTNGGALPEVVGDAGIQVPVKDSESLARAISDLLDDGERRQQLGLAGRQRIEQLFCWTRAANQMTNYYYRVLAGQDDA
jgi:glycosyltransferase involved in cell wall biosynthesis